MFENGNIVSFNESADHLAAVWCRQNRINGKVLGKKSGVLELEVGLYYKVYAQPHQLTLVSSEGVIPKISPELAAKAPVPDDVGN
jgi:hypothetical protein